MQQDQWNRYYHAPHRVMWYHRFEQFVLHCSSRRQLDGETLEQLAIWRLRTDSKCYCLQQWAYHSIFYTLVDVDNHSMRNDLKMYHNDHRDMSNLRCIDFWLTRSSTDLGDVYVDKNICHRSNCCISSQLHDDAKICALFTTHWSFECANHTCHALLAVNVRAKCVTMNFSPFDRTMDTLMGVPGAS